MSKKIGNHEGNGAFAPRVLIGGNEPKPAIRLTNMVSETTCRLNGVLAAVIGLRECPTDPLFGGVIQLIEDLVAHAQHTEEAAYEQSSFARRDENENKP